MTFFIVSKVEIVYHIDNLTKQNAIFHILICISKRSLYDGFLYWSGRINFDTRNDYFSSGILDVISL